MRVMRVVRAVRRRSGGGGAVVAVGRLCGCAAVRGWCGHLARWHARRWEDGTLPATVAREHRLRFGRRRALSDGRVAAKGQEDLQESKEGSE
jgi:hypothetical protein